MSDQARLVKELCDLIAKREAVLVLGTGVSLSASRNAPAASWRGLLLSGVKRCVESKPALAGRWAERRADDIRNGTADELIAAADLVTDQLSAPAPGDFKKWLKDEVGSLRLQDRSVLDALFALGVPMMTTNYDHLIEQALPQNPPPLSLSWTDRDAVESLIRDWSGGKVHAGVLHLHGKWEQPESVVLGTKTYQAVRHDEHTQTILKSLRLTKSLLFVGCADGLGDPNFGDFLVWTRAVFAGSTFNQYCLVRECERAKLEAEHPRSERIEFVSYGKEFKDLAPFLKSLAPKPSKSSPSARRAAKKSAPKPTPLPPTVLAYQRRLAEETRLLRMIGLGESLQIDLEIKDAYVPLRAMLARSLTGKHIGRFSKHELAEGGHAEDTQLAGMFTVAGRFKQRGGGLLGEPGAGKTTGARQLCWLLASGAQTPSDLGLPRGVVPVFLRLRNLRDTDANDSFRDFVLRETHDPDAPDAHADPGPDLWNCVQPTLWVFDGLDEVVSEPVRVKVSRRIQEFLRHRTRDHVLVTCRYQGYGPAVDLGAGFVQFHVQPLNHDQVEKFVDRWFHAAYRELYADTPKALKEADADAAKLKRILREEDFTIGGLRELRTNPLLLTVVCLVYHEEHALPRGRAALYDKCVNVLLESWRKGMYEDDGKEQRQAEPFDPRAAQRVLGRLAWWMHCQSEGQTEAKPDGEDDRRGSPSAAIKDMAKAITRTLAETAPGAELGRDGRRFIERMRDESGILVTARPECCSFLHLTFQEYLAAAHAVEEGLARELVTRSGKSWWHEPILLALARASGPFAKQFFAAFLDSKAWAADLSFTAKCLDETAVTVLDPFLKRLKAARTTDAQKVRLLQLLKLKDDPALVKICQSLAASANPELASMAWEILGRIQGPRRIEVGEKTPMEIAAVAKPGEVHVDPHTGIAFITIPAGEFEMGSNDEKPIHRVRISQPFLLGKYQVTNQEYERFLKANPKVKPPSEWSDSQFNDPQQPVVGVSWDDAQVFCQWAGCRLPTESEWEYACRAGSKARFCFGDEESKLGDYAWYSPNSGGRTHPVGQKKPNQWGLYDVHGNVWEWGQDWYGAYPKGPITDPTGPKKGKYRVLRGGSWLLGLPALLSCSYRLYSPAVNRYDGIGFRCVCVGSSVR